MEYLAKYPGRYYSLHCKDLVRGLTSVPVGQGTLDWKKIFAIAKQQDIKSYVAEVGAYGVSSLDGAKLEQARCVGVLPAERGVFEVHRELKNCNGWNSDVSNDRANHRISYGNTK